MARTVLRIGTAGWGNPPAERRRRESAHSHLQHYAQAFNAVEINSSFYRAHQRATYERWAAQTPRGFRFAVKLPRTITHEAGLVRCQRELAAFSRQVGALRGKLAVVLMQLPASLAFDARVAKRFLSLLHSSLPVQIVCEPRHADWFSRRADDLLAQLQVARAAVDPANVPIAAQPGGDRRFVYYRLHGSPQMYYSRYGAREIRQFAARLAAGCASTRGRWCIFDNTARGQAWPNARALQRLLAI